MSTCNAYKKLPHSHNELEKENEEEEEERKKKNKSLNPKTKPFILIQKQNYLSTCFIKKKMI